MAISKGNNKKKLTVAFYTLGCKVNQYETDLMMKKFVDQQYEIVDFEEKADVYVINSCSVTNLSTRKTRKYLSKAKKMGGIVVLAGCYAQEIGEQASIQNVDIVIGNDEKKDIVSLVEVYLKKEGITKKVVYKIGDIARSRKYVSSGTLENGRNVRESIKIEDGCDNFCSYCIIPYVRGRVRSRDINEVFKEAELLVKSGVKEIVLVGIEIASYGKDLEEKIDFIDVVEKLSTINGLERIRLGSLEPRILTEENIIRLSKIKKLCPHFHLSVQSLNNEVLKNMNRKYTKEDIVQITDTIRKYIQDVSFTCDIIVAFPEESKEQFEETLKMVEKIHFYEVHVFKYSKRKWTRAAKMENQVDGNEAIRRSKALIACAQKEKRRYMEQYLHQEVEVLFEEFENGYLYGYTKNYIKVKVKAEEKWLFDIKKVKLEKIEKDLMLGKLVVNSSK